MTFLAWNNEQDAQDSLDALNTLYGCEYSDGAYVMTQWAVVTKSDAEDKWGFERPEPRFGVSQEQLDNALVGDYEELETRPSDWLPEGGEL